jgi:hypothetical protein
VGPSPAEASSYRDVPKLRSKEDSGINRFVASVWVTLGVVIGWRLSQWQLGVRARRQVAAQLSLSRQLLELRAARRNNNYSPAGCCGRGVARSSEDPGPSGAGWPRVPTLRGEYFFGDVDLLRPGGVVGGACVGPSTV